MEKPNLLPDSPSFVDLCTLHQHAMRYYRLWIYACNTVLAVATLVLTVFAVSVLVDPRITLLSGVELYQPTFIYAYIALILQCGVLQTIGCLGALRLNQRLLNTYWTLLLLLMIGDIVVGLVWAIRLDQIKSNLRPNLRHRLHFQYNKDPQFTQVWDWIQRHEICCGIDSPDDFIFNVSESTSHHFHSYNPTSGVSPTSSSTPLPVIHPLPSTCCTFTKRDSGSFKEDFSEVIEQHPHNNHKISNTDQFHNSQHRIPRSASTFSREQFGSSAFARNRLKMNSNSTTMIPKTDKTHTQSGGRLWRVRQKLHPSPAPPSPPSTLPDPVMMMRSEEVQSMCELPPEFLISSTFPPPSYPEGITPPESNFPSFSSTTEIPLSPTTTNSLPDHLSYYNQFHIHQHRHGCAEKILAWVDHVTDVLFVIGFCIIVFLKGCFLAILRYEIKEMIQKIRLLNGDETLRSSAMNELIGLTSMYQSGGGSQEDLATNPQVTCEESNTGEIIAPPGEPPDPNKGFPHHHHHPHQNACGGAGGIVANCATTSETPSQKPTKRGYPPYGDYLNSNNMMYRLQRQMSQQQQNDDLDEDVDSCSALLQLSHRRSQSGAGGGGGTDKRNSTTSRRLNSMSIPIPRNGNNNNSVVMSTATALVGASTVTGAAPVTTSAAASVLSS